MGWVGLDTVWAYVGCCRPPFRIFSGAASEGWRWAKSEKRERRAKREKRVVVVLFGGATSDATRLC